MKVFTRRQSAGFAIGFFKCAVRSNTTAIASPGRVPAVSSGALTDAYFDFTEEILHAFATKKPIVTLESAIITHGMPFPQNIQTALAVENIVRENGAVPATIGIVGGRIKIGLSSENLKLLADNEGQRVKTSYRDLPFVLSQRLNGGTTVSTTLAVTHALQVPIMVTGGIGGVHRGGELSLDISADLMQLGISPVAVVCSGVKSILDIERTLEYLETNGVCVASFGKSKRFPAFYSCDSGFNAPYNVQTTLEAANLVNVMLTSGLRSGLVIAVPIPEESQVPAYEIEASIKEALEKANKEGIKGKDVTPYVLRAVVKNTGGKSLRANESLIKNNAMIGAQIAVHCSRLQALTKSASFGPRGDSLKETGDVPRKTRDVDQSTDHSVKGDWW